MLVGQLLGSGLSLTRSGVAVKLKPAFSAHLEKCWLPFASQVIDHTLMYGFVPVSIEEEASQPFAAFRDAAKRKRAPTAAPDGSSARTLEANEAPKGQPGDPQNATGGGEVVARAPAPPTSAGSTANFVPKVPLLGTYEVALTPAGRGGYVRVARVFTTSPAHAYTEDPYVELFFRNEPDSAGNIVSPIAAAFESVAFVGALKELALTAETIRATPTLVTQSVNRHGSGVGGNSSALDAASLFFDAESRAVQQQSAEEETSDRTAQLGLTIRLAAELNRLRTTNPVAASAGGVASVGLPPEVPPRMFALPDKQQLVPGALQPSARGDLEGLMRMANDAVAAALGVPASVIFEGKFSSNSMSQVQLLNTTISSIALFVNQVLTSCYRAIYSADENSELILRVAPISSTAEVQALYASNIIDVESALPAALNSLGCSAEEIASAMERRRIKDEAEKEMVAAREKTERDELAQRSKVAKLKPQAPSAPGPGKVAAPKAPSSPSGSGDS